MKPEMFRSAQHDNTLRKQLEFAFQTADALTSILSPREKRTTKSAGESHDLKGGTRSPSALLKIYAPSARDLTSPPERSIPLRGRDHALESQARKLLRALGAEKLARDVRVKWNPRLKTCAGRADYRERLVSLNPLLLDVRAGLAAKRNEIPVQKLDCLKRSSLTSVAKGASKKSEQDAARSSQTHLKDAIVATRDSRMATADTASLVADEVDRTLRHELAHLLAQWRVGRRRIAPHGVEWRRACRDLGIADEARCHNLPFATKVYAPRYVYRCPNCNEEFPRVRRIRRAIACLACCRVHNRGQFDPRFRLKLTTKL